MASRRLLIRSDDVDKGAKIKIIIAVVLLLVGVGIIGWYLTTSGGSAPPEPGLEELGERPTTVP